MNERRKERICSHSDCTEPVYAKQMCGSHYRQSRRKQSLEATRRWQERNRAQHVASNRAAVKKYQESNPEKVKASRRNANTARRAYSPLSTDSKAYDEILRRDPCSYCGASGPVEVDHIVAVANGGTNDWWNLTAACRSCNASKRSRSLLLFMADQRC